jgi:hypothetical protein
MNRQAGNARRRNRTTFSDLHPLGVPFPPLQHVGLFAAASVRALADFAHLNAAARECVTQMGVRDKALPAALRADIARGADRAAFKCAWECEALEDALFPNARQLGIDVGQVELLIAFRDVGNLPASWSLSTPLAQWVDVKVTRQGAVFDINLSIGLDEDDLSAQLTGHVDLTRLPASLTELRLSWNQLTGTMDLTKLPASLTQLFLTHNQLSGGVDLTKLPASLNRLDLDGNQLTGAVDLTRLPASLTQLILRQNQLTGVVDLTQLPATLKYLDLAQNHLSGVIDLTQLPASLTYLWLQDNAGLAGVWRGDKPSGYKFNGTGITAPDDAEEKQKCVIA